MRSVPPPYQVALYGFSRNLHRISPLSADREQVVRHMRKCGSGDETAIFDAVLLTLRDAAKVTGPRKIVVFTNGPDDASRLAPMHVLRVAEETGTSVDIISIQSGDSGWRHIAESFSRKTGGRAVVAAEWRQQSLEFARITEQIENSYVVAYRPQPRSAAGYRKVEIRLKDHPAAARAAIRTRDGYWANASQETAVNSARFTSRREQ